MHAPRPLAAAAVALVLVAAGCGDDDAASPTGAAGIAPATTADAPAADGELPAGWGAALDELRCEDTSVGGFPRTVVHDGGETRIESAPQRVVSIEGTTSLDLLLAMGITPAAAGGDDEGPAVHAHQAYLAGGTPTDPGFPLIAKRPEVNVEAIAAARPDLVISQSGWLDQIEDQVRALGVPVVVFEWGDSGEPPDWRRNVRIVAEAVGRDACIDEIVGDVDAAIDETRTALEAAGVADDTFGAFIAMEGYTASYGADDPIGLTLSEELGLELVPSDGAQTEFSLETATGVLVAEQLLATDFFADGATQAFLDDPVVAPVADRVTVLGPQESEVAYYPSAIGLRLFLEVLQDRFA